MKQQHLLKENLPKTSSQDKQITHLQKTYGLEAIKLIKDKPHDQLTPHSDVIPKCEAEIQHAIKNEHAQTPTDILARRCRLAMVDTNEAKRLLPLVQKHLDIYKLKASELNLEK